MIGQFTNASNATVLVRLLDRDPTPTPEGVSIEDLDPTDLAVYKPQRGERPLWDFPTGTLHLREVAAHVLSELVGWDLVPLTVLREDGPFGQGSVQRFVPHDPEEHWFVLPQRHEDDGSAVRRQLERMVLLDAVMANADRKGGHVLLEQDDDTPRVRVIDHGVTFHVEDKLRTVAWDYAELAVRDDDRRDLADAHRRLAADTGPFDALLSPAEVVMLLRRLEDVADWEVFPLPTEDGSGVPSRYPWPLL